MTIYAKDCKCCKCGKASVAFWPVCDPDIESHPYCQQCLDETRHELILVLLGIKEKDDKKAIRKALRQHTESQRKKVQCKH